MEKKAWVQPLAVVQQFVANEYVAACWGVVCDVPANETDLLKNVDDEIRPNKNLGHRKKFCGDPSHYQIRLNDNNVPYEMYETQTDNLGDLKCTLYTDATYTTQRDISTVKASDYLYWTTQSGSRIWSHHGPVTAAGNSNHS